MYDQLIVYVNNKKKIYEQINYVEVINAAYKKMQLI